MHAHRHQHPDVDRENQLVAIAGWEHVAHPVASQHRDPPLVEPRQATRIETRHPLVAAVPRAELFLPRHPPGPHQQHVAFLDAHPMRTFGGVEVLGENALTQLHPFEVLKARDIEQNAAAHDPVARDVDPALACAPAADLAGAEAVVHLALPEHVAEGVEMGERHPVRRDREVVQRGGQARARVEHHVRDRRRIVGARRGRERQRHRDRLAALHQPAGGGALLQRDEVERAAFVVLAPAAPVAELLKQAFYFGGAEPGCGGAHRLLPGSICLSQSHSTRRLIPTSRHAR